MTPEEARLTLMAMMDSPTIEHLTIEQRRAVDCAIGVLRARDMAPLK
jgi:hypothetical protein